VLHEIKENGPNVKIVAGLSWGLFENQSKFYQDSIISESEWLDAMVITNTSLNMMNHWIKHSIVRDYSLSADWDNRWRSGGSLDEVIDEAHLSAKWQQEAINKFANEREMRINSIRKTVPVELIENILE
jgi:transketolase